jgi:hypothetical protein
MENTSKLNQNFETIAWGTFFVMWGIIELFTSLPDGIGMVGIGLIFLGLNVARTRNGLPVSGFSTTLGVLAVLLGGLELAQPYLHLSFEIPYFAILLIVVGASLIARQLKENRN